MSNSAFFFVLWVLLAGPDDNASQSQIEIARRYVAQNGVYVGARDALSNSDWAEPTINIGRDPETSVTSFVHAIRRHAARLLSREQAEQWEALVVKRGLQLKRLHDERNVLRWYFFACAWEMPLRKPGVARQLKEKELLNWLDVWMEIRLHEQIAHHQFCRDAFGLLTNVQRDFLQRGDWDDVVKKSTGHKRAYFGDKVVIRVLGKPNHDDVFRSLSEKFALAHVDIQTALLKAEARFRRAGFTLPSLSDDAMVQYWLPVDKAYRAFFMSQVQHIDELSRAGYKLNDPKVRNVLVAQPANELFDLDNKIETKLPMGRQLRDLMETAVRAQIR